MPNCLDCGIEVIESELGIVEVRCDDCEYRMNLKRGTHLTLKYCIITIGIIGIGETILVLLLNALFYLLFS